jgi:transcriptional regulator with XRE-family HTH domain
MSNAMTPARFIRKSVFGIQTQEEFASLLDYEQATISRFENGVPFSSEAQRRIRMLAEMRKIDWDNNWFFEVPCSDHSNGRAA